MRKNHVNKLKHKTKKFLKNNVGYVPLAGMLAITGLVTANLRTLPSTAETSSATLRVAASCSFLGNVTEAHEADIIDGQYIEDIGSTILRTYCNDANGYEIYATGYSNDEDGNTNLIEQLDTGSTDIPHLIATGLYPGRTNLTTSTPSSWSMKLTPCTNAMNANCNSTYLPTIESDTNGSFSSYHIIPETSTKVASYPAGTSGDYKTDSSLTTTYDAYVSQTQPSGTYTGKVKYTMVQIGANLSPCNPAGTTIETIKCMQDINSSNKTAIMASMTPNTQYQLMDVRDNKDYYLAKLETSGSAPGNPVLENGKYYQVWMTQNLDLCIGCEGTATTASENTDIHPESTQSIYSSSLGYSTVNGVTTWTPVSTAVTSGRTISGTSVSGWSDNSNIPYSAEGGDAYVVTSGNSNNDTVTNSCNFSSVICPHYLLGNYYNWSAAIASNNSSTLTANYAKADNSVCPAGWMLPTGMTASSGYSDYNYLSVAQGIATNYVGVDANAAWATNGLVNIRNNPSYFVRAGGIYGTLFDRPGVRGGYWASTTCSGGDAYDLLFNVDGVYPSNDEARRFGWSIRCIVR